MSILNSNRILSAFSRILILSLLAAAFVSTPAFAAPPGVTPITQCGTVISQPGSYILANDLFCFFGFDGVNGHEIVGADGVIIVADNVTLMLNGHTIAAESFFDLFFGNGISVGVGVAKGNSHVTIVGPGTITGFQDGVLFEQVSMSSVVDVASVGNEFGFAVNGGFGAGCNQACPSTKNNFQGNTASFNSQHGFTLNGCNNTTFRSNNASNNEATGFLIVVAANNSVLQNTANSNGIEGITIAAGTGTGNAILMNTATSNGLDLNDGNPNCDTNNWNKNTFGSANQSCIQ